MPKIKYKLISDPTFNDYLGTIQFVHGVCEIDSEDVGKMQEIERFKVVGFEVERIDEVLVEEKKPRRTRGKGKSKKGKRGKGSRKRTPPKPKPETYEEIDDFMGPLTETKETPPKTLPHIEPGERVAKPDLFEEKEIEQSTDQPEPDGEGRSGDSGKDDSIG
jgi:hypothetical protein